MMIPIMNFFHREPNSIYTRMDDYPEWIIIHSGWDSVPSLFPHQEEKRPRIACWLALQQAGPS